MEIFLFLFLGSLIGAILTVYFVYRGIIKLLGD